MLEKKASILNDILDKLTRLANDSEDEEWLKSFQDVKPLGIQSF